MSRKIITQYAYVLHRRDYRESSLLVELLTREKGRVSVVARAVKKSKTSKRAMLEPFVPLEVNFTEQGQLHTLTEVEAIGPPWPLTGMALWSGLYLNELLVNLLHSHDSDTHLFTHYELTLAELAHAPSLEASLRKFEYELLRVLGYAIQFNQTTQTHQTIQPENFYTYRPDQGLVPVSLQEKDEVTHVFLGEHLLAIANNRWENLDGLRAAKIIFRQALNHLLGGKSLKSRDCIAKITY